MKSTSMFHARGHVRAHWRLWHLVTASRRVRSRALAVLLGAVLAAPPARVAAAPPPSAATIEAEVDDLVRKLIAATPARTRSQVKAGGLRYEGMAWETGAGQAGTSELGLAVDHAVAEALDERGVRRDSTAYDGSKGIGGAILRGGFKLLKSGAQISLILADASSGQVISKVQRVLSAASIADIDALLPPDSDNARQLAQMVRSELSGKASPITLTVTTERGSRPAFVEGEPLRVLVRADRDCHLRLYHISWTDRSLTLVFPNRGEPDGFLQADRVRQVPGEGTGVTFEVAKPYGVDAIIALASETPFGDDAWVDAALEQSGALPSASAQPSSSGSKGVQRVGNYLAESGIDEARAKGILSKGLLVRLPASAASGGGSAPLPVSQPSDGWTNPWGTGPADSAAAPSAEPVASADAPQGTLSPPSESPASGVAPSQPPPATAGTAPGTRQAPPASGARSDAPLARAACFFTTLPQLNLGR